MVWEPVYCRIRLSSCRSHAAEHEHNNATFVAIFSALDRRHIRSAMVSIHRNFAVAFKSTFRAVVSGKASACGIAVDPHAHLGQSLLLATSRQHVDGQYEIRSSCVEQDSLQAL